MADKSNAGISPRPLGRTRGYFEGEVRTRPGTCNKVRLDLIELNRGDDLPIAATNVLIEDSDEALSTNRLERIGDREHDSIEHSVRKCDIPMAEVLLLGFKIL